MTIVVGDCRQVLAGCEPETFHAVVTDPPYELNFMGRGWDNAGVSFDPETWRAVWRVLKPGGHLLAFSGTRTSHRMVCAIEDAGFEVRDSIVWLTGQGFPKSLDVGKAIDKQRKDDPRPVCQFLRAAISEHPTETVRTLAGRFGFHSRMVEHWAARDTDSQPSVPTWDQWITLKNTLRFGNEMDAEVWRLNGRKGKPGDDWDKRKVLKERTMIQGGGNALQIRVGERREVNANITAPATDAARDWDGWGTALKPSHEPICVARKPFRGTVAANVMAHGTGALNIAACRITSPVGGTAVRGTRGNGRVGSGGVYEGGYDPARYHGSEVPHPDSVRHDARGRWPPNVAMDEDAAAMLDAMSGERGGNPVAAKGKKSASYRLNSHVFGLQMDRQPFDYGDTGGASRFMYVAKSSRAERCQGLGSTYTVKYNVSSIGGAALCEATVRLLQRATSDIPTVKWLTGESGASITALCQQDSLSITLMETRQTTAPTILNLLMHSLTSASTLAVNSEAENGGSLAESVVRSRAWLLSTTNDDQELALGVVNAALTMLLKASAADAWQPMTNIHSTVKPVALMRWLVRMVTPPGGQVLDPFMGSGSTGVAAALEGFDFTGIDLDPEYVEIARRRIAHFREHGESGFGKGMKRGGANATVSYGRMRVRRCNVCGTKGKESGPGGRWPNCVHEDWAWVSQEAAGPDNAAKQPALFRKEVTA